MAVPFQDFGIVLRRVFRFLRFLSYGLIGVVIVLLTLRVLEVYERLAAVHPLLGVAFLLAMGLALAWFVGRPLARYFRMPVTMRPPKLPPPEERKPVHLVRHLNFMERYIASLEANPEWTGELEDLESALATCHELREKAEQVDKDAMPDLVQRVDSLEGSTMTHLLAPLDRKAADAIRAEALRVGIATAVSPYGSLDAFLVLWRNCNLVARIATIYYGRPGTRGTLRILRDVSAATLAGAYLQEVGNVAGEMVGSLAGKTAGFFTGPLMEGCLNAVATLRVGYMAKGRCRAFSAWTERTRSQAAAAAVTEAAALAAGLVSDVIRTVGGGLLSLPVRAIGGLVDKVSKLFHHPGTPEVGESPA